MVLRVWGKGGSDENIMNEPPYSIWAVKSRADASEDHRRQLDQVTSYYHEYHGNDLCLEHLEAMIWHEKCNRSFRHGVLDIAPTNLSSFHPP